MFEGNGTVSAESDSNLHHNQLKLKLNFSFKFKNLSVSSTLIRLILDNATTAQLKVNNK